MAVVVVVVVMSNGNNNCKSFLSGDGDGDGDDIDPPEEKMRKAEQKGVHLSVASLNFFHCEFRFGINEIPSQCYAKNVSYAFFHLKFRLLVGSS